MACMAACTVECIIGVHGRVHGGIHGGMRGGMHGWRAWRRAWGKACCCRVLCSQIILHVEASLGQPQAAIRVDLHTHAGSAAGSSGGSGSSGSSGSSSGGDNGGSSGIVGLPACQLYMSGVRLAIREGGCCASRATFVGAALAAWLGAAAVPPEWLLRVQAGVELERCVDELCRARD
eukprot:359175-Chlamydomonas_euryale.AAC.6